MISDVNLDSSMLAACNILWTNHTSLSEEFAVDLCVDECNLYHFIWEARHINSIEWFMSALFQLLCTMFNAISEALQSVDQKILTKYRSEKYYPNIWYLIIPNQSLSCGSPANWKIDLSNYQVYWFARKSLWNSSQFPGTQQCVKAGENYCETSLDVSSTS